MTNTQIASMFALALDPTGCGADRRREHSKDSDCTVNETDSCVRCHVQHGDPCPSCGQRVYHADGCKNIG